MKRILIGCVLAFAACTQTYNYDPATAGDPEGTDRPLRGKSADQFIRGIYADLLGRTPESYDFTLQINGVNKLTLPIDEQAQLVTVLEGLGDSLPIRNLIVNGLLHGTEVAIPEKAQVADPKQFITDQFRKLLGREPNVYELEAFATAWASDPAVGPRSIIRAIVGSREYQSQ